MSSFNYLRSRDTADRLIQKFGMSAVLVRPVTSGPIYDPTIGTPQKYPLKIAVINWSKSEQDSGRVLSEDKKLLMSAKSLVVQPALSDKIEIVGIPHWIVGPEKNGYGITPLAPGGTVVYYEVHCRT